MPEPKKSSTTKDDPQATENWPVFIPERVKVNDPSHIHLASINGRQYFGRCGEQVEVPVEVARISHRAGIVQGAPPPGTAQDVRQYGGSFDAVAAARNPQ